MTGPHQLCYVNCGLPADECSCYRDIMSRAGDPAVLAALPEVQALIAAAYEAAATCTEWTAWGQRHNLTEASRRAIRALTPADATAALARIVREAEARGMVKGMREAATLLREQGYGTAPKQILARAAEIEGDSK